MHHDATPFTPQGKAATAVPRSSAAAAPDDCLDTAAQQAAGEELASGAVAAGDAAVGVVATGVADLAAAPSIGQTRHPMLQEREEVDSRSIFVAGMEPNVQPDEL